MGITLVPPAATNKVSLRNTLTSSGTFEIPGVSVLNPVTATVVAIGGGAGGLGGISAKLYDNQIGGGFGNCGKGSPGGISGSVTVSQMLITGPVNYTIGAGGTGGASNDSTTYTTGGAGGDTIFGGQVIAPGGKVPPANLIGIWATTTARNTAYWFTAPVVDNNAEPAAGGFGAKSLRTDGTWMSGMAANTGPQFAILNSFANGSHAGGFTPAGKNSTTGGAVGSGRAGEAGGTAGGGTPGLLAMTGFVTTNGAASSSSASFALQVANQFYGGGGGGGSTGNPTGGAANAGGAGGAATLWGGTGGTGGTGGVTSGAGTAAGNAGTAASGYGAGGGGGGGFCTGATTTSGTLSLLGGAGGAGSQGVIYIFY